jgi:integrase/recombinase XerD
MDVIIDKYVINNRIGRMSAPNLPVSVPPSSRLLSSADFHRLADVPLVIEWFANINNPQTQRAYRNALEDFMKFTGIERPDEFREAQIPS